MIKLNHLGYSAMDLEEAIDAFLNLGYTAVYEAIKRHEHKNMYVQRVKLGDLIVELMATADKSKLSFIREKLEATTEPFVLNHLCYDVDDIHKTVEGPMAPGVAHPPMYDENILYPCHQYETTTPGIFMAPEMQLTNESDI